MNKIEIAIIKNNIKNQLTGLPVAPLFVSGKPGTSKSTTVQLLAKELDMHLLDVSCPSLTHESLSGLPQEYLSPDLDKYTVDNSAAVATRWSIPEVIADANKLAESKPTILLLDDFHMVQSHLQAYFFKLLLQRSIGNYKLASNVVIIGTLNDSSEAGFKGINSAVRNRMALLRVDFNFDYWFESYGKSLHYFVASFLKAKPQHISSDESTSDQYSTARSWSALANEIQSLPADFATSHSEKIAAMHVSENSAKAFATHVNYVSAIDFQSHVDKKTPIDISKREPQDAIICSYIARFIQKPQDGLYLLDLLIQNIKQRSFVGFTFSELYDFYQNPDTQTEGISLIIKVILGEDYVCPTRLSQADQQSLDRWVAADKTALLDIAKDYLI